MTAAPCTHQACQRCKHCGEEIEYVPAWAAEEFAPWAHTATGNSMCYLVAIPADTAAQDGADPWGGRCYHQVSDPATCDEEPCRSRRAAPAGLYGGT